MADVDLGIEGLESFEELGSGGFATVYVARDPGFNRQVAVKVMQSLDEVGRRQFERERGLLGQFDDVANIVTPYRFGYSKTGSAYLVMEYLKGGSLQDLIEDGPVPLVEAIGYVLPIAQALGQAHEAGVLHRDIKPANVLLTADGVPKLADFGIASLQDVTSTQMAFTMAHTPPEAFTSSNDVRDERSDLYSLASTLYALVVGRGPFEIDGPDSPFAHMHRIGTTPVPSAGTGKARFEAFLRRALAKDPAARHQSASQFIEDLEAASAELAGTAEPPTTEPALSVSSAAEPGPEPGLREEPAVVSAEVEVERPAEPAVPPAHLERSVRLGSNSRRSYVRYLVALGVVLVAVVAAIVFRVGRGGDDAEVAVDPGSAGPTSTLTATTASTSTSTTEQVTTTQSLPEQPTAPVVYNGHPELVWTVVELADGRLASGGENTILIWDPASPRAGALAYEGHSDRVVAMVELADGRVASAGWGATVHLWHPDDPSATLATYSAHARGVEALIELSDGRIASAATDDTVRIWDPDDPGTTEVVYQGHLGPVRTVIELSDGRLASAGDDATVQVWDPDDPESGSSTYIGHDQSVEALAQLSNGRVASASAGTIHVWSPSDIGGPPVVYRQHDDRAMALVGLADGRVASASLDSTVQVWDPARPDTAEAIYPGHAAGIVALIELSDGRLASAGDDATVQVWDPADWAE